MVAPLGDGLADSRDRALLLFGFAGALRRSELVAEEEERWLCQSELDLAHIS